MKIHLVRHGETDSNKAKKLMGQRVDESLNAEGRKQAEVLAEKLKHTAFDIIFTSPLKRARETAEAIHSKRPAQIIICEEIMERDFGSLSGKSWEEMAAMQNTDRETVRKIDMDQRYDYRPYGGESAQDVHQRLLRFVQDIKDNHNDKKVIVVAHGGILRAAELIYNNNAVGHIENTAIIEFDI